MAYPERLARAEKVVGDVAFFVAACCEWEDWRHFARIAVLELAAQLNLSDRQTFMRSLETVFAETRPLPPEQP